MSMNSKKSLSAKQIQEVVAAVTSSSKSVMPSKKTQKNRRKRNRKKSKNGGGVGAGGFGTLMYKTRMDGFQDQSILSKALPFNGQRPRVGFTIRGQPLKLTDYTNNDAETAIRVMGRCLDLRNATAVSIVTQRILTPNTIDPRLTSVSRIYQSYAFREVRMTWVPEFRGTSQGQIGACIQFFDTQSAGSFPTTLESVLYYDPSDSCEITETMVLSTTYTGPKLWGTATDSELNDEIQYNTFTFTEVSTSNGVAIVAGVNLGFFVIDYIIDLYNPCPSVASPELWYTDLKFVIDNLGSNPKFLEWFVKRLPLSSKKLLRYFSVAFLALEDHHFEVKSMTSRDISPPLSQLLLEERKEDITPVNSLSSELKIPLLRR